MEIDLPTLTVAAGLVALLSSVLIAGAWTQIPRSPALLWWAVAIFCNASGIMLLVAGNVRAMPPLMAIGIACFVVSPALVWAGVRVFAGRRASLAALAAGPVLWLALNIVPLNDGQFFATAAGFVPTIVYLSAAIHELWRGRGERLPARWALMVLFAIQVLTFVGGVVDTLAGRLGAGAFPPLGTWFGVINFESLIYSIGSAAFMILIAKERREQEYIAASRQDSLTGAANRGALLAGGERLLQRCRQEGLSFSLVMLDLDHFKWINDTHGHAAGDEVIRAFSRTASGILRANDLLGRYGGEEFVVVLPRATIEAAYVIAERIRVAFAAAPVVFGAQKLACTVSAGIATATSQEISLEDIIKSADECLYRAKEMGRNRVERPARTAPDLQAPNVIRVA